MNFLPWMCAHILMYVCAVLNQNDTSTQKIKLYNTNDVNCPYATRIRCNFKLFDY